ncbi:hypothetical protein D9M71_407670 [compost metagenome]
MQVPVEAAALFGPIQGQPYAPVQRLARPAQVQTGEAEENQDQGAGTGDLAPGIADGQEAVQTQHQVEKALAADVALERAGVGIEVAHRPTAFARGRCEVHLASHVAVGFNPERLHCVAGLGFDLAHQFCRRQGAAVLHLDGQGLGVEQAQDFFFEGPGRAGDAHQRQYQSCADAEEPVQLKQGFLQHVDRLAH